VVEGFEDYAIPEVWLANLTVTGLVAGMLFFVSPPYRGGSVFTLLSLALLIRLLPQGESVVVSVLRLLIVGVILLWAAAFVYYSFRLRR